MEQGIDGRHRRSAVRRGGWMRGAWQGLRVVTLTCCLAWVPPATAAEDYAETPQVARDRVPAGTAYSQGRVPAATWSTRFADVTFQDWLAAARHAAARWKGTRVAADLVFGAAAAEIDDRLDEPDGLTTSEAIDLLRETITWFRTDDPHHASVVLRIVGLEIRRGNIKVAERDLQSIAGWENAVPPADLPAWERSRWTSLARDWDARWHLAWTRVHVGLGRNGKAAEVREAVARRHPPRASVVLMEAARLHVANKDLPRALDAADRAHDRARSDAERSEISFWRLLAEAGMLNIHGNPGPTTWPKDPTFLKKAVAWFDSPDAQAARAEDFLYLGSLATMSQRPEAIVAIYTRALDAPAIAEMLRKDPSMQDTLLAGVIGLKDLGRLDEAEALLDALVRTAGEAAPISDAVRASIRSARADTAADRETPAPEPTTAPVESAVSEPAADAGDRGLLQPEGQGAAEDAAADPEVTVTPTPVALGPWMLVLGILAVGVLLLSRARARR